MGEETLIQQMAQGDARAFGKLVGRYQRRIVRFGERMLGESEAAQDIAQETFLRLWRARSRCIAEGGDLAIFLLRIARNLCLDTLRARRPTEVWEEDSEIAADGDEEPAASAQTSALADAVSHAVQTLPEAQRVVFVLSHYEGMSYKEIAEVVGCPVGTVASRKYQAVETLRRRLKPWIEEEARA